VDARLERGVFDMSDWKQEQSEIEVDGELRIYRWQRKDSLLRANEYVTFEMCNGKFVCFGEDGGGTKSCIEVTITPRFIDFLRKIVEAHDVGID
jgi:hypothetical protein